MAARITDKQKKKIIADYLENPSYSAVGRQNGVCNHTVRKIIEETPDISDMFRQKKDENTADILAYMESRRGVVCEIIEKGLAALNDPDKLAEASPTQITTAIGTLIDKWALKNNMMGEKYQSEDDPITKSLKEEIKNGTI